MSEVSWQPTAYRAEIAGYVVEVDRTPPGNMWWWRVHAGTGWRTGRASDIGQAMAAAKQAARRLAAENP